MPSIERSKERGIDYSGADLRNTRFAQTYMNNTNFSGADLRGAIFDTSAFENADFRDANREKLRTDEDPDQ